MKGRGDKEEETHGDGNGGRQRKAEKGRREERCSDTIGGEED